MDNCTEEFIKLVELYQKLINCDIVDLRVLETVIQMIMSYVPVDIERKIKNEIH